MLYCIQVLRDECEEQKNNLDQMNQSGSSLLDPLPDNSEEKRLAVEQLEDVNRKWDQLQSLLDDRQTILLSAMELGADAVAKHNSLVYVEYIM